MLERKVGEHEKKEGSVEWYKWLQVNGRPDAHFTHNSVDCLCEAGTTG